MSVNLLARNEELFDESMLFCATEVQAYAVNGVTLSWGQHRHLTWGTTVQNLDQIPHMDFKDCIDAVCKEFSKYADVSLTYVKDPSRANLVIVEEPIDGPSGVLGDCQMPVRPHAGTQLKMRIDKTDRFVISDNPNQGAIDLYTFSGHEMQHFWGVGHQPASIKKPARIQPFYNVAYRYMQQADIDEMLRRYPKAIAPVVPAEPAPVAPGSKPILVRIENGRMVVTQDGVKEWGVPLPSFAGKLEVTLPRTK